MTPTLIGPRLYPRPARRGGARAALLEGAGASRSGCLSNGLGQRGERVDHDVRLVTEEAGRSSLARDERAAQARRLRARDVPFVGGHEQHVVVRRGTEGRGGEGVDLGSGLVAPDAVGGEQVVEALAQAGRADKRLDPSRVPFESTASGVPARPSSIAATSGVDRKLAESGGASSALLVERGSGLRAAASRASLATSGSGR